VRIEVVLWDKVVDDLNFILFSHCLSSYAMASGNSSLKRLQSIKDQLEPATLGQDIPTLTEPTPESTYPYPTDFKIRERPVDHHRELKVAVIGGGLSGITAGILLPKKVPNINLTIIEKNGDLGGTWLENAYPGVRCDVPAHVYQSTFEPNTQWSEVFAQGPEILAYWQGLAKKHDVFSKTRFNSKVTGAYWDETRSQWHVKINDTRTQQARDEYYDFVIPAIGHFNEWKLPEYPGIETFKGHLRHSSNWDPKFEPSGRRVAVIGNGASGVQVVPNLQPLVSHLDHYARSPTWIAGAFAGSLERQLEPTPYSAEQLESFQDPEKYHEFRKALETTFWRRYETQLKGTKESEQAISDFRDLMAKRLEAKPELLEQLVPDFSPHCRRLTPGPGYLEALTKDNVSFIRTPIERVTEDGIVTNDGVHRPVDAIICSTGANVDFAPPFPIVSGEVDLSRDWRPEGRYGFPYTYLGVGMPGFANLMFLHGKFSFDANSLIDGHSTNKRYLIGPNASGASGTLTQAAETQVAYIAKVLRKVANQDIATITPQKQAADDFVEYCDAFFPRTVLSENCSSWANGGRPGGRIHGMWPGSAAHVTWVRREPRWEDFDYTYVRTKNRFAWLGNGRRDRESDPDSDATPYLKVAGSVDLRDYHESWWDL
jgi:cation diffusion facilitator CzcD-associated flavoprotein CzcO